MAYCINPEIISDMERCCVDKFKRIKLLPFFLPSQAKFFQKDCNNASESDLLEYFINVPIEISRAYWPTSFPSEEAVVKSPVFEFMCDSITDEHVYYRLLVQIIIKRKVSPSTVSLILLITLSIAKQNPESYVPVLHNLSMVILNELVNIDCSNPLPRLLVHQDIESTDVCYAEQLDKLWEIVRISNGEVESLIDYLSFAEIFVQKSPYKNIDGVVQRTFQVPSNFNKAVQAINSARIFRQVINGIYISGHFPYKDVMKISYMAFNTALSTPDVAPQIIHQLASFIVEYLV